MRGLNYGALLIASACGMLALTGMNARSENGIEKGAFSAVEESVEEFATDETEAEETAVFQKISEGVGCLLWCDTEDEETEEQNGTESTGSVGDDGCGMEGSSAESETEPAEESATATVRYSVAGKELQADIYDYLEESLTAAGVEEWLPYALCQAHQESGFNPFAENKNGLDKGLFQYRVTYWDFSQGDIFDWKAQIDKYVSQVSARLASGCTIEETISRHYTSDYVTAVDEKYVSDVLSWMSRMEVE